MRKRGAVLGVLAVSIVAAVLTAWVLADLADDAPQTTTAITQATGVIEITLADGTKMTVTGDDVPVAIPPGATITVLEGTATLDAQSSIPGHEMAATIVMSAGSSATISLDITTGELAVNASAGSVDVVIGNTLAVVEAGEALSVTRNTQTGNYDMSAVSGEIATTSGGQTASIDEGTTEVVVPPPPVEGEPPEPETIEGSEYLPG